MGAVKFLLPTRKVTNRVQRLRLPHYSHRALQKARAAAHAFWVGGWIGYFCFKDVPARDI